MKYWQMLNHNNSTFRCTIYFNVLTPKLSKARLKNKIIINNNHNYSHNHNDYDYDYYYCNNNRK